MKLMQKMSPTAIFFGLVLLYVGIYAVEKLTINASGVEWEGVSGMMDILMVLLTLFLVFGLGQGAQTVKQAINSRNAELLNWTTSEMDRLYDSMKIVMDAHRRQAYCTNFSQLSPYYISPWTQKELEAADEVSIFLQRMGYYAITDLISKEHYLKLWGPKYLSCWYSLEGWVRHKRILLREPIEIERGGESRKFFEEFALYCEAHLPNLLVMNTYEDFKMADDKSRAYLEKIKQVRKSLTQK